MAQELFPWQKVSTPEVAIPTQVGSPSFREQFFINFRKHLSLYILLLLVVLIMAFRPVKNMTNETEKSIDVLVVMLPTAKGTEIVPETLKAFPVREKSLSKTQLMQVIRMEDISNLRGRLVAKKNLPPNQPIFWNDVSFKSVSLTPTLPKVMYPQETP